MSDWLTYSPSSGHGNGQISITATSISDLEEKVQTLIAYNDDESVTGFTIIKSVVNYSHKYLTLDIISGGTIVWKYVGSNQGNARYVEYKINDGPWTGIVLPESETINVNSGDKIMFKGNNTTYGDYPTLQYQTFSGSTATFDVYGNIMSLVYGDSFYGKTALSDDWNFPCLFKRTKVINAENLILPTSNTQDGCYYGMFDSCHQLVSIPELPASALSSSCYAYMFSGCTNLTTPPVLQSVVLDSACYQGMFAGCVNLATAPALPTSMYLKAYCYMEMFSGCTSLTTAPTLPATVLKPSCYESMFFGCSNLGHINCSALGVIDPFYPESETIDPNTPISLATNNWVSGVAQTGIFIKNPSMSSWTTGNSGIPTGWIGLNSDATLTGITFSGLTWVTDVPYSGGTADSGNCSFAVAGKLNDGSLIDITNIATVTGSSIVVSATTASTRENVGTISLTASYSGYTDNKYVTAYQEAYSPYDPHSGRVEYIYSSSYPQASVTITAMIGQSTQDVTVSGSSSSGLLASGLTSGDSFTLVVKNNMQTSLQVKMGYEYTQGYSKTSVVSAGGMAYIMGLSYDGAKTVYVDIT